MTTYLLILIMFAVAFILQIFFTSFQMKGFNLNYARLHKMGRVAIGRSRGGFNAGAIAMFAIDNKGNILTGCYLKGITIFAKWKDIDDFNGRYVGGLKKEDCEKLSPPARKAILNASENYITIMSGGEVENPPSLFGRIGGFLTGKNRKKKAHK
jgi:glucitol operon activator protein